MFFNRKSTDFQQALATLKTRLESVERKFDAEVSDNRRNLLEYAELGEKMRRLYLRIARRAKIEGEATSADNHTETQEAAPLSALEIRDAIEKGMGPL